MSSFARYGFAVRVMFVVVLFASAGVAQKTKAKPAKASQDKALSPAPAATAPQQKADEAIAGEAFADTARLNPEPEGDYIPCRFTMAELSTLQRPEEVLRLSSERVEQLIAGVEAAIRRQAVLKQIDLATENDLLQQVATGDFAAGLAGLTPSQALQKVITGLHEGVESQRSRALITKASGTDLAKAKEEKEQEEKEVREVAPVIDSARRTIQRLTRPTDVGCAMSVLSYRETSRAYGYIIANNYIAVQVVVRNLNENQQFVLHDVEMAVMTDPEGRPGRFFSGRDKVLVRSLSAAESAFDPRNLVVHVAQGVGAVMSAVVPIYGGAISDAASVYNSGFFPGLEKVWKDLSTDQLNLLNDTGFSSTTNSQTVVPKTGSAMFVTFIPSKQFEQGWWTGDCVSKVALGTYSNKQVKALIPLVAGASTAQSVPSVDVERALRLCSADAVAAIQARPAKARCNPRERAPQDQTGLPAAEQACETTENAAAPRRNWWGKKKPSAAMLVKDQDPDDDDDSQSIVATMPKRLFRQWSGNSVALFQELSTVVVAGMHVVDNKDLQAKLLDLHCNPDSAGTETLPDTGTLECKAKGKNLDKVSLLRLRNPAETAFAEGSLMLAGGENEAATISFPAEALHKLGKADYEVEAVDKHGVEAATGLVLHFGVRPALAKPADAIDLGEAAKKPVKITLAGWRLEQVQEVKGVPPGKNAAVSLPFASFPIRSDTAITLELTTKTVGTDAGSMPLTLLLNDGTTVATGVSLELTAAK